MGTHIIIDVDEGPESDCSLVTKADLDAAVVEIKSLIGRTSRAEMHNVDQETNKIAAELEKLAVGMNKEQVDRLLAHAERLKAMGKPIEPIPVS